MTPCESWPTRLAPTIWRMTSAASATGVPAASNRARPISSRRSALIFGMWASHLFGPPASCRHAGWKPALLHSGRFLDVGGAHQPDRFRVAHDLGAGVLQ